MTRPQSVPHGRHVVQAAVLKGKYISEHMKIGVEKAHHRLIYNEFSKFRKIL